MVSRIGVGEDDNRNFRSSEGAQLNVLCPTAISAGGKSDAFDLGEELDVEDRVVLEVSMTGEMRRPSAII